MLNAPEQLRGNMLIALGESLLGRYIEERTWLDVEDTRNWGARCYQIRLLPANERECFLTQAQLHEYLILARMVPHPEDAATYRITLNNSEGFFAARIALWAHVCVVSRQFMCAHHGKRNGNTSLAASDADTASGS